MSFTRREILTSAVAATSLAAAGRFVKAEAAADASSYQAIFQPLDRYVESFLRESNSPGLTLVLADRQGVQRAVTYGFSDKELHTPVRTDELFQIGSISKSFTAISLLQLYAEGRLDLHKPVQEYLPWLRIQSDHAPITAHHLLTHSSGLPAYTNLLSADPSYAHRTAYAPGSRYFYNNMGYEALGHLAWTLDGRQLPLLLRERVLSPLGMNQSEPAIDFDMRARLVKSYTTFQSDRPQPRAARLCEAPPIIYTTAAGCVAATARDMGLYIQMIANHGQGPRGRLLSPEAFELFSTGHIAAPDFGDNARYAYGMAVDRLDGNTILFHTGGMLSFVSSLMVDMDAGVGAFASVNALDKTVTPIVRYASQLMRAHRERRSAPSQPPPAVPAWRVEKAAEYAGVYRSGQNRSIEVVADGERLFLKHDSRLVPLEPSGKDKFLALHADFSRFVCCFGRQDDKADSPVVELGWGDQWFTNARYSGPKSFNHPAQWLAYVGHYCDMGPRIRSTRIVIRKGRLLINGVTPLKSVGDTFVVDSPEPSPEWLRFGEVINGCCMWLNATGTINWREAAP